jgi:HEAT repeat protein
MRVRITKRGLLFAVVSGLGLLIIIAMLYVLSPSIRIAAVSGAERIGADGFLVGRLSDIDQDVRAAAAEALMRRGEKAVPSLVRGLDDSDPLVRALSAFTLARLGPHGQGAVPVLKRLMREDPDPAVRERTAKAFGQIAGSDQDTITELIGLLGSGDELTRIAAAEALGAAGEPAARAVPNLILALRDRAGKVRAEAAEALRAMGVAAKPAIPALIDALVDSDPAVRGEATQALVQLTGRSGIEDAGLKDRIRAALDRVQKAMSGQGGLPK